MQPVIATITGGGLHSHSSTPHVRGPSSSGSEPSRALHCALVLLQVLTLEQHTSWYLYQIYFKNFHTSLVLVLDLRKKSVPTCH
jgi:hypothetical protein